MHGKIRVTNLGLLPIVGPLNQLNLQSQNGYWMKDVLRSCMQG